MSQPRIIISVGYRGWIKRKNHKEILSNKTGGGLFMGSQPLSGIHLLLLKSLTGCRWIFAHWDFHALHHRRNLSSDTWNHPAPKPYLANLIQSPAQHRHVLKAIASPVWRRSVPFNTAQTVRMDGLHSFFPKKFLVKCWGARKCLCISFSCKKKRFL